MRQDSVPEACAGLPRRAQHQVRRRSAASSSPARCSCRAVPPPPRSTDHSGKRLKRLLQGDPPLRPGQRRPQAEVDAVAEGQVVVHVAVDVEAVGVGKGTLVPAGRAGDHHDLRVGRDGLPVDARRPPCTSGSAPVTGPRSGGAPRRRWGSSWRRPPARPAGPGCRPASAPAQPRSRATVSVPALPIRRAKIAACSSVSRRSSPSSSTISPLSRSVNMSSRGDFCRSSSWAVTYSMQLAHGLGRHVVVHPLLGVEVELSSIQPRTMSRSSGGHAEQRGDHVGRDRAPKSCT